MFDLTAKSQVTKAKLTNWDGISLENFCAAKETSSKVERQLTEREKIFTNHMSNKELIAKMHKELKPLSNRDTLTRDKPFKSGQKK